MKHRIKAPMLAAALVLAGLVPLAACSHTMQGAGQDIQNAGQSIEQTGQQTDDSNPNTP
ncbi:MAG TPA: entericidin A/B family lipoprotein [Caulobacterales bacterium]|nr:entericidin A/B family lipoprotein [Caulobacterales bacterium]